MPCKNAKRKNLLRPPTQRPVSLCPKILNKKCLLLKTQKRETIPLQVPPASYCFSHSTQHWAMKSCPIPDSRNQSENCTLATHFVLRKISVSFPSTARKNSRPTSALSPCDISLGRAATWQGNMEGQLHPKDSVKFQEFPNQKIYPDFLLVGERPKTDSIESSLG